VNIHVSRETVQKHPEFDFRGKAWEKANLTWIDAYHKRLARTFFFCFELECGADEKMYEFICKNGYFG